MKTLTLAAAIAVALGLAGTVLAVPTDATVEPGFAGDRSRIPTGTEPLPRAPEPRAKFIAPRVNDVLEVLVTTTQRPVRIRLSIQVDGKSIDDLWRERMKKLFDYCDRDGSGTLSEKETKFAFSDVGLAQVLQNGFYQPGQTANSKFSQLDVDGNGSVSFEEFIASFPRTIAQLLRILPGQPDSSGAAVTEVLFKLFDLNGDGKLTREELKRAEKFLATHDGDEDECLSVQELVPVLYDPRFARPVRLPAGAPQSGQLVPLTMPVAVYEANRIPGTVTQQIISKYDKNGDFELAKAEIAFDDATFKALDKDGNGRLDGEELDVWRTGAPDIELLLSLAQKPADCVAKIADEKSAEARGFKIKQVEGGRLVLHVGRQPVDLSAFASGARYGQQNLKQQYSYLFTQAAAGKDHVLEKDLNGANAVQFQFIRVIFEGADRDGDGKLTKAEFDAYFDVQEGFRNLGIGLTPSIQTPSLFQLLDENRDGRLGVRELRTAWNRLIVLEESGAEVVTKNIIQPAVNIRLSRAMDRFYVNQPVQIAFNGNPNQVIVPSKGPPWFRKMDRNADGDVSRSEYIGTKAEFDSIDADADGLISLEEAESWDKATREKDGDQPEPKPDAPKPEKPIPDRKQQEK